MDRRSGYGEFSVASGWFNSEVMLYMAFGAVANYTQPNFELGYALKFRASGITGIDRIIFELVGIRTGLYSGGVQYLL